MALITFFPFPFPHVLLSSGRPPVPNPILESHELQSFCSLPRIPILALAEIPRGSCAALNPSLLHLSCKEAREPISVFHVVRPSEVSRYWSSAINECRELACWLMTTKLICWSIFIPRQIFEKDVFQKVGNLVSCKSNPVSPPGRLYSVLLLQYYEL